MWEYIHLGNLLSGTREDAAKTSSPSQEEISKTGNQKHCLQERMLSQFHLILDLHLADIMA